MYYLVAKTGLEPVTRKLIVCYSNQLSYFTRSLSFQLSVFILNVLLVQQNTCTNIKACAHLGRTYIPVSPLSLKSGGT